MSIPRLQWLLRHSRGPSLHPSITSYVYTPPPILLHLPSIHTSMYPFNHPLSSHPSHFSRIFITRPCLTPTTPLHLNSLSCFLLPFRSSSRLPLGTTMTEETLTDTSSLSSSCLPSFFTIRQAHIVFKMLRHSLIAYPFH